ncbi:hypothetical protein ACFELO_08630 [Oceanicaulis sp. LC35]|uniref:hypothetical protein n=1 Tax=Oceanicaulis sp. LC35 TaxID=3349635 RepID=UPI003F84FA0B
MGRAAFAGLVYFAIVFAIGFVLGSIRVLLVSPCLGELGAVLLELPVMLGACWLVSGALTARLAAHNPARAAIVMGGVAFTCLMLAEFTLGALAFERGLLEQVLRWGTPAGALGLFGQIGFALFPWIQRRRTPSI